MASATLSKLATAVPPRFLISSTTSSAGAALEPEPSDAPPGSLTTTLAPSAAHSSAISRPMPRPAPVTRMTLSCSDFVMWMSPVAFVIPGRAKREPGISRFRVWSCGPSRNDEGLPFVRNHNRAARREHAADAVTHRNLRIGHLRRRDAGVGLLRPRFDLDATIDDPASMVQQ